MREVQVKERNRSADPQGSPDEQRIERRVWLNDRRVASRERRVARRPPRESPSDAIERVQPRRVQIETGDVVVTRERVPQVNPKRASAAPQWRYRIRIHPDQHTGPVFNGFAPAASHAEQIASVRCARIVFIEDELPVILADYRKNC